MAEGEVLAEEVDEDERMAEGLPVEVEVKVAVSVRACRWRPCDATPFCTYMERSARCKKARIGVGKAGPCGARI